MKNVGVLMIIEVVLAIIIMSVSLLIHEVILYQSFILITCIINFCVVRKLKSNKN